MSTTTITQHKDSWWEGNACTIINTSTGQHGWNGSATNYYTGDFITKVTTVGGSTSLSFSFSTTCTNCLGDDRSNLSVPPYSYWWNQPDTQSTNPYINLTCTDNVTGAVQTSKVTFQDMHAARWSTYTAYNEGGTWYGSGGATAATYTAAKGTGNSITCASISGGDFTLNPAHTYTITGTLNVTEAIEGTPRAYSAFNVNITIPVQTEYLVKDPSCSGNYTYNGASQSASITDGTIYTDATETTTKSALNIGYTQSDATTTSATDVGTYTVTWTLKSGYAWSDGSTGTKTGTWKINKASLTITGDSATKTYDGTALTKDSATASGLKGSDTLSSVTLTGSQTEVGSSNNTPSNAVIKRGSTTATSNYTITYANGTLKVTKANGWVTVNPTSITVANSSKNNKNVGTTTVATYHPDDTGGAHKGGDGTVVTSGDSKLTVSRSGDTITVTATPNCTPGTVTVTVDNPETSTYLDAKTTFTVTIQDVWKTATYYHGSTKIYQEDVDTTDSYTLKASSSISIPSLGLGWNFYGWADKTDSTSTSPVWTDAQTFDWNSIYGNADCDFYTIFRKKINLYYDVNSAGSKTIYCYRNQKNTTNPTGPVDFNQGTDIYTYAGWEQYYWLYNRGSYAGTDIKTTGLGRDIKWNSTAEVLEYNFDDAEEEWNFYMLYKRTATLDYDVVYDGTTPDRSPACSPTSLPGDTATLYYNSMNSAANTTTISWTVNNTQLKKADWEFLDWTDADDFTKKYNPGSAFEKTPRLVTVVNYTLKAEWKECMAYIWMKQTINGVDKWRYGPAYFKKDGKWWKGKRAYIKYNGRWMACVLKNMG